MVSVCQICKEPIWNFFCPDCLATDIKKWLPVSLASQFDAFHKHLLSYFHSGLNNAFNWCLNCKTLKEASICPYCYTNEVIYWLKDKNVSLANKFAQLFPFDFEKIGHKEFFRTHIHPITDKAPLNMQFGICDCCGEYSDELVNIDGEWVCEKCRD